MNESEKFYRRANRFIDLIIDLWVVSICVFCPLILRLLWVFIVFAAIVLFFTWPLFFTK